MKLRDMLAAGLVAIGGAVATSYAYKDAVKTLNEPAPGRTISVCVLNSQELPQTQDLIDASLRIAAGSYATNHNIDLTFQPQRTYEGNIYALVFEKPASNPLSSCASEADIALLFTSANNVYRVVSANAGHREKGRADEVAGFAIIYGLGKHDLEKNCLRQPYVLANTVKHEIGHLFSVGHSVAGIMKVGSGCGLQLWSDWELSMFRSMPTKNDLLRGIDTVHADSVYVKTQPRQ